MSVAQVHPSDLSPVRLEQGRAWSNTPRMRPKRTPPTVPPPPPSQAHGARSSCYTVAFMHGQPVPRRDPAHIRDISPTISARFRPRGTHLGVYPAPRHRGQANTRNPTGHHDGALSMGKSRSRNRHFRGDIRQLLHRLARHRAVFPTAPRPCKTPPLVTAAGGFFFKKVGFCSPEKGLLRPIFITTSRMRCWRHVCRSSHHSRRHAPQHIIAPSDRMPRGRSSRDTVIPATIFRPRAALKRLCRCMNDP